MNGWVLTDEYKMLKPMYADEYGQIHKNFSLIKTHSLYFTFWIVILFVGGEEGLFFAFAKLIKWS